MRISKTHPASAQKKSVSVTGGKREAGESLSTYVQNVRIGEAKTPLPATGLKTCEVAERVGIPDPIYFSRIFKKPSRVKPKDFRRDQNETENGGV